MTKFRYVINIVTVLTLVFALAACSGAKDGKDAASKGSKQESASDEGKKTDDTKKEDTSANNAAEAKDPLGKYDPPIDVSVIGTTGTNVIFVEGESIDDNVITRIYQDKLGINFKNKWVSDVSQATEKLNLAITSNDLPDITRVDITQLQRMINSGQLEDLTQVYEQYASPLLRKAMEYGEKEGFVAATRDGKIYGMPNPVDYYEYVPIMYIRQDWLDKLQLQPPKTIDELYAVAKAFADQDPDGNNKKDTYGIAFDNALGLAFDGISSAFKAYRATWFKDGSGNLVYGSVQPEMKEALAKMQEMYKAGIFDTEFGAKDWGKTADDTGAGKGGIYFGAFWAPLYPLKLTKDHTPNSDWKAYPIPVGADGTVVPKRNPNVAGWMVARKGMEHPEAMIKAMNLWAELWMDTGKFTKLLYEDVQGSDKYKGVEVHQYAKPYFYDDPGKNIAIGRQFREAMQKDDPAPITHPDGKWKWESYKKDEGNGWGFMKYLSESELVLDNYKENYRNNEFLGAPTDTMVKRNATLNKLELETFTKIIMGNAPVDEFDNFVKQWKSLGGDKITEEVNAWAKAQK